MSMNDVYIVDLENEIEILRKKFLNSINKEKILKALDHEIIILNKLKVKDNEKCDGKEQFNGTIENMISELEEFNKRIRSGNFDNNIKDILNN